VKAEFYSTAALSGVKVMFPVAFQPGRVAATNADPMGLVERVERGYGAAHRRLRKSLRRLVESWGKTHERPRWISTGARVQAGPPQRHPTLKEVSRAEALLLDRHCMALPGRPRNGCGPPG